MFVTWLARLCAAFALVAATILPTAFVGVGAAQTSIVHVSPNGDDARSGSSMNDAVASLERAAELAKPGTEIRLAAGTYVGRQSLSGLRGTAAAPIRIVGAGANTIIDGGNIDKSNTLLLEDSSHIRIESLTITRGIHGTIVTSSDHINFVDVRWHSVGQEALAVQGASSHISVRNCSIRNTGVRGGRYERYGEAIYLGSADSSSSVSDVEIIGCSISNTTAEAIDIKPDTQRVLIRGNTITDVDTANSGAIVSWIGRAPKSDPDIVIHSNVIRGVTTTSPYSDGNAINLNSPATVYNNVMTDLEHRGVIVQSTVDGAAGRVQIFNNTIYNARLQAFEDWSSGSKVDLVNNIGPSEPGNIASSSALFVNPSANDFRLASSNGAVDFASAGSLAAATDVRGVSRSAHGTADAGAYEYQKSASDIALGAPGASPTTTTAPRVPGEPTASASNSSQQTPSTTVAPQPLADSSTTTKRSTAPPSGTPATNAVEHGSALRQSPQSPDLRSIETSDPPAGLAFRVLDDDDTVTAAVGKATTLTRRFEAPPPGSSRFAVNPVPAPARALQEPAGPGRLVRDGSVSDPSPTRSSQQLALALFSVLGIALVRRHWRRRASLPDGG